MPHAFTEDQLVEQPAIGLFAELGWQTVVASEEVFGASGSLGRESSGEVVLVSRLRGALLKLNPLLPCDAIDAAVDELTRDRGAMSLASAMWLDKNVKYWLNDGDRSTFAFWKHLHKSPNKMHKWVPACQNSAVQFEKPSADSELKGLHERRHPRSTLVVGWKAIQCPEGLVESNSPKLLYCCRRSAVRSGSL